MYYPKPFLNPFFCFIFQWFPKPKPCPKQLLLGLSMICLTKTLFKTRFKNGGRNKHLQFLLWSKSRCWECGTEALRYVFGNDDEHLSPRVPQLEEFDARQRNLRATWVAALLHVHRTDPHVTGESARKAFRTGILHNRCELIQFCLKVKRS